jgi:hypothetical protein
MPVVKFIRDFDWKPVAGCTIAFKAGMERLVTTACASRAIDLRRAEPVVTPRRRRKSDAAPLRG